MLNHLSLTLSLIVLSKTDVKPMAYAGGAMGGMLS